LGLASKRNYFYIIDAMKNKNINIENFKPRDLNRVSSAVLFFPQEYIFFFIANERNDLPCSDCGVF